MSDELVKELELRARDLTDYCHWCGVRPNMPHHDYCAVTIAREFVETPAKHEVNGIIANALEALAKQVRESDNDVTELGSIGVGRNLISIKLKTPFTLYSELALDLTPPPPPPAQNDTHNDDDDTDDQRKGVR